MPAVTETRQQPGKINGNQGESVAKTAEPERAQKSRRVQVVFDERAVEVLERLRASTGGSVADVVRDALGFYDWARQQTADGKSVAVVDHANNRVREFILPFRAAGK